MKKSLLTIALVAGLAPLTFAAQAPQANPPATGTTPDHSAPAKTKKHHKKSATKKNQKTDKMAPAANPTK
jgi:hypothetical protein